MLHLRSAFNDPIHLSQIGGLLGAAASRLRGAGSACGKGPGGALEKGLWVYNTAQRVTGIQDNLQSGDIVGADRGCCTG